MNTISVSAVVVLLSVGLVAVPAPIAQAQQFYPGECVDIGGYPGKVIEVPSDHPGYVRVQNMRRGRPGGIALYLDGQVNPDKCDLDLVHEISCPTVPPDGAGGVEGDARDAVRRAENTIYPSASVQFQSFRLGRPRALTYSETQMFPQAATEDGIVDVSSSFVSCRADDSYVTRVQRAVAYVCFVNADEGNMECDSIKQLDDDRIIDQQSRHGDDDN